MEDASLDKRTKRIADAVKALEEELSLDSASLRALVLSIGGVDVRVDGVEERVEKLEATAKKCERMQQQVDRIGHRVDHLYTVRDEDLQAEQERESGDDNLHLAAWKLARDTWGFKDVPANREAVRAIVDLVCQRKSDPPAPGDSKIGGYGTIRDNTPTEGGDADAVAERHDRRSERTDVTTGAGAASEQDAPAPMTLEEWEDHVDHPKVTHTVTAQSRPAPSEGSEGELEPDLPNDVLAAIRDLRDTHYHHTADRLHDTVQRLQRELRETSEKCPICREELFGTPASCWGTCEDDEGEVEPVARISDGGDLEVLDDVRGIVAGDFLYSHDTVQHLQRERDEARERATWRHAKFLRKRIQELGIIADERLECMTRQEKRILDLEAEIAHLSDPENWTVVVGEDEIPVTQLPWQDFKVRYVGPDPETQEDDDGTE